MNTYVVQPYGLRFREQDDNYAAFRLMFAASNSANYWLDENTPPKAFATMLLDTTPLQQAGKEWLQESGDGNEITDQNMADILEGYMDLFLQSSEDFCGCVITGLDKVTPQGLKNVVTMGKGYDLDEVHFERNEKTE